MQLFRRGSVISKVSAGGGGGAAFTQIISYSGNAAISATGVGNERTGQTVEMPADATTIRASMPLYWSGGTPSGATYQLAVYTTASLTSDPTTQLGVGATQLPDDLPTVNPFPTENVTLEVSGLTLTSGDFIWVGIQFTSTPTIGDTVRWSTASPSEGPGQRFQYPSGSWSGESAADMSITVSYA